MSSTTEPLSHGKKYAQKMLALIERDPQIAALQPKEEIGQAIIDATSLQQAIDIVLLGYADRPALGERSYDMAIDPGTGKLARRYLPNFSTITYAELRAKIVGLSNAWRHHPEHGVAPGEMVCIMGFTSRDFAVIDFACVYAQAVTVPLQSATSGADLTEIFANVAPATVATTISDLEVCTRHAIEQGGMRSLVVFDYDARDEQERERFDAAREALAKSGVATRLTTIDALIEYGSRFDWTPLPAHPDGLQRMAAILHSSGSTGKPKGAVMPEDALKLNWEVRPRQLPMLGVCFAPLNHLLGRSSLTSFLRVGGTAFFTLKPDMSTLFEDIRLVRPTYLIFFPRIFEMIYQHFQGEVARRVRSGEG
ncbi:MAG: AMP-binding protein, partial [Bryobacteraceae bacterium]|nr:AMP-binding protein [Bryobacteraceae bacterium]